MAGVKSWLGTRVACGADAHGGRAGSADTQGIFPTGASPPLARELMRRAAYLEFETSAAKPAAMAAVAIPAAAAAAMSNNNAAEAARLAAVRPSPSMVLTDKRAIGTRQGRAGTRGRRAGTRAHVRCRAHAH